MTSERQVLKHKENINITEGRCRLLQHGRNRGAALIPIIIAIVIISTIGAVLLSLSSVGTFTPILGNSAQRAYYLAESGYRYAALKFRQGGESTVDDINDQTLQVGDNQEFTLQLRTHKLQVTAGGGSDTLNTEAAFGYVPEFENIEEEKTGYLKIGDIPAEEHEFSDVSMPDTNSIDFQSAEGTWSASSGDQARFAALSTETSDLAEGGDLQVQSDTNAVRFFPEHNGRFSADGKTYQYATRDGQNYMLRGITRVDGDWEPPALEDGDEIVLIDFVEVNSTGSYGQGVFGATRKLTYHVPFSESAGGERFHDTFDDMENWEESAQGGHDLEEVDGDSALVVDDTSGIYSRSLIEFNRDADQNVDLEDAWSRAGNYLSYDAQVKIMVDEEANYLDGISFRLDEEGSYYGLSLLYTEAEYDLDGIPDGIVPKHNTPLIVLWETDESGWPRNWIAYHELPEYNYVTQNIFFEDDVESDPKTEEEKWSSTEDWSIKDERAHSPEHSWRNEEPSGKENKILESRSIDLSDAEEPRLHFWHWHDISGAGTGGGGNARARIEISEDEGENWDTLGEFDGDSGGWQHETYNLTDSYAGKEIMIRFDVGGKGNSDWDGKWYIDDIYVYEEKVDWPTLMVSVKEAESVSFESGEKQLTDGD
ncbi:MAG: hypothetical protein ACOCP6_02210, partial [Desulfosalsimonas sp.]